MPPEIFVMQKGTPMLQLIYAMFLLREKKMNEVIEYSLKHKRLNPNLKKFINVTKKMLSVSNSSLINRHLELGCLKRSQILFYLACRYGVCVTLKVGFWHYYDSHNRKVLSGHAWVELDGEPYFESQSIKKYKVSFEAKN